MKNSRVFVFQIGREDKLNNIHEEIIQKQIHVYFHVQIHVHFHEINSLLAHLNDTTIQLVFNIRSQNLSRNVFLFWCLPNVSLALHVLLF